ncbi:uncharacterized protein [Rutidosis leptorrhynchoides]|uniref:uncharacterized protein n=1 Tax=Rutidosis leptorrhynchoides TaxID=125765 RepID=UPI003A99AA09
MVHTMLVLIMKPFSVLKLCVMASVRAICVVINTWVELMSASIYFNVSIFWKFVLWTVSLITIPVRAVVALRREKQLLAQFSELQDRLDSVAWDKKELEEYIRVAIKELEMTEIMLGELEDEHDEAIHKIEHLETELQGVKDENLRLKEVHGKSQWDAGTRVDTAFDYGQKGKDGITLWKSDHYKGLADVLMRKHQIVPGVVNKSVYSDSILDERREVVFSQSLFSAILSVLVGMIIWEAQDPCMPLVTALFMVVGMSLKSVVQFFFTIKNKPASDAVALLSLNWFILGTLSYPTLPKVAQLAAPFFTKLLGGWFWF